MSATAYQRFLQGQGVVLPLPLTEGALQVAIRRAFLQYHWLFYHTYRSTRSAPGYPDIVAVKPPRLLCVELKSATGTVTPDQQTWLTALGQVPGIEVYVWRPADLAEALTIIAGDTPLEDR